MPYPIIIGLVFIVSYLVYVAIKNWRKAKPPATTPPPAPGAPAAPGAPPATLTPKTGMGFWTKVIIVVAVVWTIIFVTWKLASWYERDRAAIILKQEIEKTVEEKSPTYEWYWKLPDGLSSDGRNETAIDERIVEAIPRNDDSIWADQHYMVYGKPEIQRIRLHKTGDKTWEGNCDQDNPELHRRLSLVETSPGVYAGKITWQDGKEGICYLKKRK